MASGNAEKLMAEADKVANKKGIFGGLLGGGPNYDEAADLYKKAANAYKLKKDFKRASDAYVKCSHMHGKEGENYQEANMLKEAGDCMKQISGRQALDMYLKSADIYNAAGKFNSSGRMFESLAQSFEQEGDISNAAKMYRKAGELFELDEFGKSKYATNMCKWADLASLERDDNYDEAISVYEKVGKRALQSDLGQYGARKHFMKAVVLFMVKGDAVTADVNLERYCSIDSTIPTSREGKLLTTLIKAMENDDTIMFTASLGDYDSVSKLSPWHVHFFTIIKKRLDKMAGVNADAPPPPGQDSSDDDLC